MADCPSPTPLPCVTVPDPEKSRLDSRVDWRFLADMSISLCWTFSLSLVLVSESICSLSDPSVDMVVFTIASLLFPRVILSGPLFWEAASNLTVRHRGYLFKWNTQQAIQNLAVVLVNNCSSSVLDCLERTLSANGKCSDVRVQWLFSNSATLLKKKASSV